MAVSTCKRMDDKRANDNDKSLTIIDLYRVITDSDADTPATILNSNNEDVPKVGDPHPDPGVDATVKSRRVRFTGNRKVYILEVTYDNNANNAGDGGGGGGGGQINVLEVQITSWYEDYIQEYEIGQRGNKAKLIKNTAGDPIKYEARRPHPMITISAQTEDPGLGGFVHAVNSVNDDFVSWLGMDFEPGQLLFDQYNTVSIGNNTWRENFVFKGKYVFSPEQYGDPGGQQAGWQPFILNAGLWEWVDGRDDGKDRIPIRPTDTEEGNPATRPVTEPWPLDINGKAIPRELIDERRVFLNFKIYPELNFKGSFNFDFAKVVNDKLKVEFGL